VRGAFASRQQNDPTIGIFGVLSVFKEFQAHARHERLMLAAATEIQRSPR